ncbi:hypothetical protein NDU88_004762 [Pleurodeles waltl]|uniref:Uncharacterized protein n=1 Tax=Pleurodeles waltl TaxID=8319 RepID=A0AAV7LMB4_PLEWA|nr:hypothetical protein NDU88_004762 [Pleurodeles waltl]
MQSTLREKGDRTARELEQSRRSARAASAAVERTGTGMPRLDEGKGFGILPVFPAPPERTQLAALGVAKSKAEQQLLALATRIDTHSSRFLA